MLRARWMCCSLDIASAHAVIWSKSIKCTRWRHEIETFSASLAFVRRIHRSPVDYYQKRQWRGALMFSLICSWTNGRAKTWDAGDLRCHYDIAAMYTNVTCSEVTFIHTCEFLVHVAILIISGSIPQQWIGRYPKGTRESAWGGLQIDLQRHTQGTWLHLLGKHFNWNGVF